MEHEVIKLALHFIFSQFEVAEINKRTLGKWQVRLCGNEGTENDEKGRYIRKLVQAGISNIETEKAEVWQDAAYIIHGYRGEIHEIRARKGTHQFIGYVDEMDNVEIFKKPLDFTKQVCNLWNSCKLWGRQRDEFAVQNSTEVVESHTEPPVQKHWKERILSYLPALPAVPAFLRYDEAVTGTPVDACDNTEEYQSACP